MKLLQKFRCVCGEWGQNLKEEVNGDLGRSVCTYRDWRGKLGNNHMFSICSTMSNINFTQIFLYQLINTESCKADSPPEFQMGKLAFDSPLDLSQVQL